MKTLVKTFVLGMLLAGVYAVPVFAQCDPDAAKVHYDAFVADRRAKTIEARQRAVDEGNKYLEMCKNNTDEDTKQIVDYVVKDIPRIEKWIADQKRFNRFNEAGKAKKYEDAVTVAKEILSLEPADSKIALDLQLYIASAALEVAGAKGGDNPFWAETLKYAKDALAAIEGGKVSTADWGVFDMSYKQADATASKNNAIAWMNFTAAFASRGLKNPKDGAAYFYNTTQTPGIGEKLKADSYKEIGLYYYSEVFRFQEEVKKKFDSKDDVQIEEGKKMLALARGYAERGLDAYGRAHEIYVKLNRAQDAEAALDSIKGLYAFRSGGKTEGQSEFVANLLKSSFPSPSTEPDPIAEEPAPTPEPAPATTTTTTTSGN